MVITPTTRPVSVIGDTPFAQSVRQSGTIPSIEDDPEAQPAIVLIDFDDDLDGVAALQAALDAGRTSEALFVQIASPALRTLVDRNLDRRDAAERPRVFGRSTLTASHLVARHRLSDVAFWRGQDRLHVAIVGWEPLGRACLEAVIAEGFAGDLGQPRITLIVEDAEAVRQEIASAWPEIDQSADIAVVEGARGDRADQIGSCLAEAHHAAPLTAVILARPYLRALALAAQLQAFWAATDTPAASLHLVADRPLPRLAVAQDKANDLGGRVVTTDPFDSTALVSLLVHEDALPRRLHAAYAARFFSGPAAQGWDSLPEAFRAANRAAAAHLPLKLRTIGLEPGTNPDPAAVEPHALQALTDGLISPTGEDAIIRRLARLEHERWCAERRLNGWRYAAVRDDARKFHPDLVPFDDPRLGAADIAKDTAQIRFLLGSVLRPSADGWAFPITLAVHSGSPGSSAIGLEAAAALLRREPWRPATLLCALHDEAECRTVRALIAHCQDHARRWRVIVPESGPRQRCRAAADVLARPSTVIAPLSFTSRTTEPGWVDPDGPAVIDTGYQAYLTARATAFVACDTP